MGVYSIYCKMSELRNRFLSPEAEEALIAEPVSPLENSMSSSQIMGKKDDMYVSDEEDVKDQPYSENDGKKDVSGGEEDDGEESEEEESEEGSENEEESESEESEEGSEEEEVSEESEVEVQIRNRQDELPTAISFCAVIVASLWLIYNLCVLCTIASKYKLCCDKCN